MHVTIPPQAAVGGRDKFASSERIAPISAIIPVYNGAPFLAAAIHSVLCQTIKPLELILIDDGSSDGSRAIMEATSRRGGPVPIRILYKENGGQSSARNLGASRAQGDYLAFLDQDDIWLPRHIEELFAPLVADPDLGWAYSDVNEIDRHGNLIHFGFISGLAAHPKSSIFDLIARDMFVLPSASIIRKGLFLEIGGFDEALSGYEDDDLFMRLFRTGAGNFFLPKPLSQWRIFDGSASTTYRMRRSRHVYAQKLMRLFPDDPSQARWFVRDLIAPRFYANAIGEYFKALRLGDAPMAEDARADACHYAALTIEGRKRKRRLILFLMRWPRLYRLAVSLLDRNHAQRMGFCDDPRRRNLVIPAGPDKSAI